MADTNKKFLDENGLLYYHGKNKEALAKKVDKVDGKGLSTNDFTTAEKTKLAAIDENANKYVLPVATTEVLGGIKVGDRLSITADGVLSATVQEITVDSALSETSANPVENKAVTKELKNKVDVVSGKGLSTNDYTTTEKTKLNGIAEGAQVNVVESVSVNGTAAPITGKRVDITVPTKVSELTNDSGYAKSTEIPKDNASLTNGAGYQNATQVQSAIDTALSSVTGIDFKIVDVLPAAGQGKKGVIYLLAHQHGDADTYDEYIWLKGDPATGTVDRFEKIGSTDIDLSAYWNDTNLTVISNADIDAILAK